MAISIRRILTKTQTVTRQQSRQRNSGQNRFFSACTIRITPGFRRSAGSFCLGNTGWSHPESYLIFADGWALHFPLADQTGSREPTAADVYAPYP